MQKMSSTGPARWYAVAALAAGLVCGVLSVYATTRVACAVWVVLALIGAVAGGWLVGSLRTRPSAGRP